MDVLRTFVYVDGFNFYYGALRNTPYKWLDFGQLFDNLLPDRLRIERIKYFTAKVDGKYDPGQPKRQNAYFRALRKQEPRLKIYYGHFLTHSTHMPLVAPRGKQSYAEVLKTEEKGSDVNLAIHLLNDAWLGRFDCAVVASNDSDLAESIKIVSNHLAKEVGILKFPGRSPSFKLQQYAQYTWTIRDGVLAASQLPDPIPGTKLHKPKSW